MLEYVLQLVTSLPVLSILTTILLVLYLNKSWLMQPSGLPPMPRLPVPFFGHALYMRSSILGAFEQWRQKIGDIFTIYIAGTPNIIICNHEILTEAFVKQADKFSDRPKTVRNKIMGSEDVGIIPNSQGTWKEQRSVSLSLLKDYGMGKNLMAERISIEVESYIKALDDRKGAAMDVVMLTTLAVTNVICAFLAGDRFEYDDPTLIELVSQNNIVIRLVGQTSILHVLPWLRFLPGDLFDAKKLAGVATTIQGFFRKEIMQDGTGHSNDNYIGGYLREMKKRQESGKSTFLDEKNLRFNISNLFIAGSETTSTTIQWALVYAMRYPECQDKVFREIKDTIGTERVPNIQDKPKLNYINAFILEVQRLGSIAPLGLPHMCNTTTKVCGFTIPKGAIVISNLDAIMKDPKIFDDPHVFRPERFLDKEHKLDIPKEFAPFSLGRRICLGESLAKMELFLFLSAMFQRFEILPENPSKLPSTESIFGVTMSPKPFLCRFQPRI